MPSPSTVEAERLRSQDYLSLVTFLKS